MLVLEVISGLCRDPLALVEMFVNYDCDLQAIDLFKRIVTALVKVPPALLLPVFRVVFSARAHSSHSSVEQSRSAVLCCLDDPGKRIIHVIHGLFLLAKVRLIADAVRFSYSSLVPWQCLPSFRFGGWGVGRLRGGASKSVQRCRLSVVVLG